MPANPKILAETDEEHTLTTLWDTIISGVH